MHSISTLNLKSSIGKDSVLLAPKTIVKQLTLSLVLRAASELLILTF